MSAVLEAGRSRSATGRTWRPLQGVSVTIERRPRDRRAVRLGQVDAAARARHARAADRRRAPDRRVRGGGPLRPVARRAAGGAIGFVFQQFFLLDGRSALDNVADGLLYTGRPLAERRERAHDALLQVGLAHRLAHRPNQLSGGEQQRVAVARAIVGARILFADEPTGNLDTASGEGGRRAPASNRAGTTVVVITHDRELAAGLPRQVELRDGRVELDTALAA